MMIHSLRAPVQRRPPDLQRPRNGRRTFATIDQLPRMIDLRPIESRTSPQAYPPRFRRLDARARPLDDQCPLELRQRAMWKTRRPPAFVVSMLSAATGSPLPCARYPE